MEEITQKSNSGNENIKKHSLREFVSDANGTYSHTKLWTNIANFSATIAFFYILFKDNMTTELFGAYISLVGLQRFASKYLDKNNNQGGNNYVQ